MTTNDQQQNISELFNPPNPAKRHTSQQPPSPPEPPDTTDYKELAQFWQLKYVELMVHSNQVIAALSAPMLSQQLMAQLQAQAAAQLQAQTAAQVKP